MKDRKLLWLLPAMLLLIAMLALSGCGGGNPAAPSGGGGSGGGGTQPTAISGTVSAPGGQMAYYRPSVLQQIANLIITPVSALTGTAPVGAGVSVSLKKIDNTGAPLATQPAGLPVTAATSANGSYSLNLPAGMGPSSDLALFVGAGATQLRAILSSTTAVDVNPVTEVTVQLIANGSNNLANFTPAEVETVKNSVASAAATVTGSSIANIVANANTAAQADPNVSTAVNNGASGGIPAAPTGVTATASGSAQINVNWTLVNGATGYNIYRSTSPNVTITAGNKVNTQGPVAAGPFGNSGLAAGTTYYYRVTALNGGGESAGSTEVSATTASSPQAPAAPTGVTATAYSTTQINIDWTPVTGAQGYNIYRSTAPNVAITNANKITIPATQAGPYGNSGLTAGTTYYYRVTAVNGSGESAGSTEVSATTASAPQAPAAPTGVTATASGSSQINIDWLLVNGATGYNIYRSTSPNVAIVAGNLVNTTGPVAAGPYGNSGLAAGATYYYKVAAVNANGESVGSTEVNATTATAPTAPSAPTGVTATASGSSQINIDWLLVNGATGYNIYRSTAPNVAITAANKTTATPVAAGPYGNTGLAAGTTYYYKVTAVNANGESVGSPEASATTALAAPTGVTATGEDGQVSMNWTAVAGASSYKVYRSTTPGVTPQNAPNINSFASSYTPPYIIWGLTNGTKYYFVVTVVDANNVESAPSPEVSATPAVAPTGVTATAISSTEIDINWTNAAGATGYNIYRSNAPNVAITAANKITASPIAGGPFANTGLTAGTTYYYKVTSVYPNNVEAPSAEIGASTILNTPSGVTASPGKQRNFLNWQPVAGATSYKIYRKAFTSGVTKLNGDLIANLAGTSFTDTVGTPVNTQPIAPLVNGRTYYYVVTAVNASGESVESMEVSSKPVGGGVMGVDWTEQAVMQNQLLDVVWAGNQFVAVGANGMVVTSPDGIAWTRQNSGTAAHLYAIAWSGTKLIVRGGYDYTAQKWIGLLSSSDGITWTPVNANGSAIIWDGQRFVVTFAGTSPDGVNWTNGTVSYSIAGSVPVPDSIAQTGAGYVALAVTPESWGTYGHLFSSPDGLNWSEYSNYVAPVEKVITARNQLYGVWHNTIMSSPDGITWTSIYTGQPAGPGVIGDQYNRIFWTGNQFIVVGVEGGNGDIVTSPDGTNWTAIHTGETVQYGLSGLATSGTKIVTVGGFDGVILTSP